MGKFLLVIFITIFLSSILQAQSGWQVQNLSQQITSSQRTAFLNSFTGYLLSTSGIFKTIDAGSTWIQKTAPMSLSIISSIFFINQNTGFFSGTSPTNFYKTTNGGSNWIALDFTANNFSDIKFTDSLNGWFLSGGDKFIYKTSDAGNTFRQFLISDSLDAFLCIKFINNNTGWTTGFRNVYKTTNGGVNWNYKFRLGNSAVFKGYSIDFINENTGFIVGTGGYLYKTTNGGDYWETLQISNKLLNSVLFVSQDTGWICGKNGCLLKTIDKGIHWNDYSIDTNITMNSIQFINSKTGWITTNTNKLLKTTDGGNVFVMQTSTNIPENFKLGQNYPNPFNPSTNINYSLKHSGFISLKVFYADGREAENLVNEFQSSGEYRINFDASHLPSGVYYYKMITENFSETKKMILVK